MAVARASNPAETAPDRRAPRSPKVIPQLLGQRAYEEIKEQILTGRIKPGEMVNGTTLSEELKMSRTPVHEALNLLVKEGLLSAVARVGYVVVPVTIQDLQEFFELRFSLEPLGAELAAHRASADDVALFDRIEVDYQAARAALREDQPAALRLAVKANREFHLRVAQLSGNGRLVQFVEILLDQSQRLIAYDPRIVGDVNFAHSTQHRAILEAIQNGDRPRAREAMTVHLKDAQERILRSVLGWTA